MYQQAVVRFCQGAADKEGGSYTSNIRPQNMEEAIDKMRWHQHNHQAIYGRSPRKEVKQVSPGAYRGRSDSGEARVCAVETNKGEEMSMRKEMREGLSAQGKEVGEIKSNLATLSAQMAAMMEFKRSRVSGYRAPSRSPSPRMDDKQGCYHCGEMGHFKRECPKLLGSPRGDKRVSFQESKGALNYKGATHEA